MRRGFRKTRQVMAGLLSAVLLMASLPQDSTYVYAAGQTQEMTSEEELQTRTEETTDAQAESDMKETMHSSTENETEEAEGSKNVEKQDTEEKSDSDIEETKEEKTDTEEETKTEDESSETADSMEFESEDDEQETEDADEADTQEKIVTAELTGAYQFGGAPTDKSESTAFSIELLSDTDSQELEEYLYQQMKERNETINVQKYGISTDNIFNMVSGVLNEHPELYFVNKKIGWSMSGNNVIAVKLTYNDSYDDNAFQKATREALAVVKPGMSDLEKAIVLHDYLAVNCEYDKENLDKEMQGTGKVPEASYTAYGTLVNRISVCEGYALAYKYLLNQVGIDCLMVKSSVMNHAWNMIKLNGKYYQVDVTWDDPTWDLIGRARHKHMFRSDNAFVSECEHHDWSVTVGSEVVDYKATDTSYDNAFWLDCNSPLVLVGEDCYYVAFDKQKNTGVINNKTLSDITGNGTAICDIGTWTVWNGSGPWQGAFSGLFYVNSRMYYNDKSSIYSFAFDDEGNAIDKHEEFKADIANGYIYGSAFCQGKVLYSLHQDPNESAKETVLTADITIEVEEPSEIPVEKIELDKETLTLAVGDTAVLKAVVTPNYATNADITWESSDNLVAEVSDGTVTAVAAGNCTITASAGGKEAVCKVTVNASGEDIASGSYEDITWVIDADGKLTVEGTGDFSGSNGSSRITPWYDNRASITSAEIKVSGMTDASAMFSGCENLTSVDLSGFDTSKVTNMRNMFADCKSLTKIDLGKFETGNVTNMNGMFRDCDNLTDLDLKSFNTANVTDMSNMFYKCNSLSSLDLSNFNTENVTDMSGMFSYCDNLTDLNLSGFITENVTSMLIMFQGCEKLTDLDLSGFDTQNVTDMSFMFNFCSRLTELDLSDFDTSKVTSMEGMFANCNSLTKIDMSKFETGNVKSMRVMFEHCNNLASLNLDKFDTGKVTDMSSMFYECNSLTGLDLSSFRTGNVTAIGAMFYNCANLESINLCNFDLNKVEEDTYEGLKYLFRGCSKLTTIDTPYNLSHSIPLPTVGTEDIWYQPDGTAITELPQNLSYSIKITRNSVPEVPDPYIKIQKTKTVYQCGDILNTDDLTVIYYDTDGTAKTVTDYTTNADEIDMSVQGTKTLTVTYKELTASVVLTVTASADPEPGKETYTVTFDLQGHGTALKEYSTYTEIEKGSTIKRPTDPKAEDYEFTGWYKESACKTLWDFEKDTIEGDTTLYAGWKSSQKVDEKVDEKPRINSVLFPKSKDEYSAVYTGEQIRPVMVVAYQYTDANGKEKTQKLKLNVDYTVYYSNNVNVGENTAQVTVRGIGEYTGVITRKFTITQKSIKNVTLSSVGDIIFGEEPSVTVMDGTKELVKGVDYKINLTTKGSADADTQSVLTVKGFGNYIGDSKKSVKFNILRKGTEVQPITSENIQVEFKNPAKEYTYNGKAQKPGVVVTDKTTGKKISSSMYKVIYSNNVNAGEGTAKAWVVGVSKNGKGYYGVSDTLSFDINQKDFKKVSVSLSGTIPKTGSIEDIEKAIGEAIIAKDAKHVLSENEYTIDYGDIRTVDEIKIGTKYSIILTPKAGGNYLEDTKKTVKIKFGQLNLASKTANISVKITDASQNEIEFRYNGILLEKDRDYTATVKKEKNKDTYTVKIKAVAKSAYKGSRTIKNVPF